MTQSVQVMVPVFDTLRLRLTAERLVKRTSIAVGVEIIALISAQDRDVSALALELNFPILKGLEIGASVRADKFSDFGNTVNPKLSLRWAANPNLLVQRLDQHRFHGAHADPAVRAQRHHLHGQPLQRPGAVPGRQPHRCGGSVA